MAYRKRGFVAGILFLAVALAPAVAVSGQFEDAVKAYNNGDFHAALNLMLPLGEQGDPLAQNWLRNIYLSMYWEGGHPTANQDAVKWTQRSAEQGNTSAQRILGHMYGSFGQGLPHDDIRALTWLNVSLSQLPEGPDREWTMKRLDMIARRMTPDQIAEAQKLAREWKPTRETTDSPE